MATKIQLTPSELLAQSTEMTSLQAEYESLFGNVTGVLTDINDSWSANLANNFLGKITSAQSAFSNLTGLLQQGAEAARTSANTLESVDSALAAAMAYDAGGGFSSGGGGSGSFGGGGGGSRGESASGFIDDLKDRWNTSAEYMEYLKEKYDALPQPVRDTIESVTPKDAKAITSILYDIFTGNADYDTLNTFLTTGGVSTTKAGVVVKACQIVLDRETNTAQLYEASQWYQDQAVDHFRSGEIGAGFADLSTGLGVGLFSIATGSFDVITEMGADFVGNAAGMVSSGASAVDGSLDMLGDVISRTMGNEAGETINNVLDSAGDIVSNVGDAIESGVNAVSSFFRGLY